MKNLILQNVAVLCSQALARRMNTRNEHWKVYSSIFTVPGFPVRLVWKSDRTPALLNRGVSGVGLVERANFIFSSLSRLDITAQPTTASVGRGSLTHDVRRGRHARPGEQGAPRSTTEGRRRH